MAKAGWYGKVVETPSRVESPTVKVEFSFTCTYTPVITMSVPRSGLRPSNASCVRNRHPHPWVGRLCRCKEGAFRDSDVDLQGTTVAFLARNDVVMKNGWGAVPLFASSVYPLVSRPASVMFGLEGNRFISRAHCGLRWWV